MKKSIILFLVLTMCGSGSEQAQTEVLKDTGATSETEDTGEVINHMTLVDYPAKLYFAGDIPTEVHGRVEYAFSIIQEKLGKYPVEVYFVGTDENEKDNLSNVFCSNRENAGNFEASAFNSFQNFDDCLNFIDERYFSMYLQGGLETEQKGYSSSGNKGHNGQFEQLYHLLVWSKPIGFEVENGEGYNQEFSGVFHEYWHVFQMAHMDFYRCSDRDIRSTCSFDPEKIDYLVGGIWLQEGTAVFKEKTILEEQYKIGNLKNIHGDLLQELNNQYFDGQRAMEQCPGKSIRDITYQDSCSQAAYGWGAWAAAYLAHKVNDPYVFENVYYPELKKISDPELVFSNTFGMTIDEFFADFDSWILGSESERNYVIPIAEEETGRLYYPSDEDTAVANEDTAVSESKILWGATDAKPEVYAAADVSQTTIDLTVEWVNKAIGYWGSYGPLEIWIVGTGKDEVIALDEQWCEVRSTKDPNWNKEWDCANGDPYGSGNGWSPFYGYINDGGAAVSSYIRDHLGYYFNALIMSSKYPGPEEEDYKPVILHEYFHVYQHGNLSIPELPDTDGDWRTSNRNVYFNGGEIQVPFLMEGGAEYMAQYWYSKEPGVEAGYLKRVMEYKAEAIKPYFNTGKSLRELGYDEEFNSYDILTWFVAYLIHNSSEETFRVNFWSQLETLGFEEAFRSNFGKSADEMIAEFDTWVAQPIDVLLEIIP